MEKYQLGLMTEIEAQQAFAERSTAILPVGSLEQHGPFLPAATDAIIAERISLIIGEEIKGIVLPTIPYGNSFSWSEGWTSTITLSQGRLSGMVYDVGKSVAQKGCKYFLVFNGHGSNPPDIVLGTKRLKEDFPDLEILMAEWWGAGSSVISELKETKAESHGGEFETSIMLYLASELVLEDRYVAEYADNLPDLCYRYLIVKGGKGDYIKRIQMYDQSISASGIYGDPRKATVEKGSRVVQRVVENIKQVIKDLEG